MSRVSDPLYKKVSNKFIPNALLQQVDPETFARFVEWAYTGTYTAAAPEETAKEANDVPSYEYEAKIDDSPSIEATYERDPPIEWEETVAEEAIAPAEEFPAEEPPAEEAPAEETSPEEPPPIEAVHGSYPDPQDDTASSRKNKKKKKKSKKATQALSTDDVAVPQGEESTAIPEPLPEPNGSHYMGPFLIEDDTSVPDGSTLSKSAHLLSHAKLWTFANRYRIAGLCDLTTRRLSFSLQAVRYHQERIEDIADLVRYVYADIIAEDGSEKLRGAVTSYTSDHFEELVQTKQFGEMLKNGGQFVADTSYMLGQRLRKERCEPDPY